MKYMMIKVKMKQVNKPVWRNFYVNENINLFDLAVCILSAFNAQFEHMFLFRVGKNKEYVDKVWLENFGFSGRYQSYDYRKFTLKDILKLNESIVLAYDTGEGYEFDLTVLENKTAIFESDEEDIILMSGRGYGIIENNIDVVWAITKGLDLKEYIGENLGISYEEFLDYVMPIDPYEYFDKIDIEQLQENMKADLFSIENFDR